MYLRSVTMKGFKSFPEKTELAFSPGVSVIVAVGVNQEGQTGDGLTWIGGVDLCMNRTVGCGFLE